jgi:hypothetical protein
MTIEAQVRAIARQEIDAVRAELLGRPLTVQEVAELFGVSHTTVHNWRKTRDPRLRLRMYNLGDGSRCGTSTWRRTRTSDCAKGASSRAAK